MNFQAIRNLAKSSDYQIIYNRAKELSHIKIFDNESDFSKIQLVFLSYLQMYSILNQELQMGNEYLTEEVLKDWTRTEAYLIYRRHKENKKDTKKSDILSHNEGAVIFKRPVKK